MIRLTHRTHHPHRRLGVVGALVMLSLALGMLGTATAQQPAEPVRLTLLHDTHFHGELDDPRGVTLAHFFGLARQLRAAHPNTLMLGVGDDLAPSLYSATFRGEHMIAALNAAGLDVNTFGNHEFDYGPDVLRARIRESAFPWVTANVLDAHTGDAFGADLGVRRFVLRPLGGVMLGFTGFAPAETARLSSPGPDVLVLDPIDAARQVVPQMRAAGAQVIIVLSHLAWPDSERLAAAVDGIDVIVGDHASTALRQPRVVNGTIVSRRGDGMRLLGQLDLEVAGGRIVGWRYAEHPLSPDLPPDPAVDAVLAHYRDALDAALAEVVGVTAVPLDARAAPSRSRETNLGNLLADALRDWGQTDVGLQNGGGIRSDRVYDAGPLSRRDLAAILPFANYAATLRLSGAALRDALEHSVGAIGEGAGRFLQVSGLAFTYDPAAPPGSRVREVAVGGVPLDPTATYTVALNDYLATGGDEYTAFAEAEVLVPSQAGPLITAVLADYVATLGTVEPAEEGRIRDVSDQ